MKERQSNTQKAVKGMTSQTLVTITLGVVEIVSFAIMSRLLTQQDFGYYAAITAITTVFASFSETGMGASIIQRKNISESFINNAFTISCIVGVFAAGLLLIFSRPLSASLVDNSLKTPLMLMSITLLSHNITSVNTSIMYKRLEFLKVGIINLASLVITTIVAIVIAYLGFGYYAILTKAILSSILTLLLSFIGAKTYYRFQVDIVTIKQIFSFSGWLTASVFFRNLALQMDRLLMSRVLSVEALGAYNRPKEFINQISTRLNGIFDTALFPVLSEIQDELVKIRSAYIRSLYYMNMFAIVLSIGFIFNSELIIRIFFGNDWLNLLTTTQILSCALIFNIDARLADCYLRSLGWTKQQFYFRVFEVIVKLIGVLVGSYWGINGVAISVLLVNLITTVIKNLYICKKIQLCVKEVFFTIFKAWKVSYFIGPVMFILFTILPHTTIANIVNVVIFILLLIILFLFFPSLVGDQFKKEAYPTIISLLKKKLKYRILSV